MNAMTKPPSPLNCCDSAQIGLKRTWTRIRGGGYGSEAWVAYITGRDPKYRFAREFCRRDTSGLSGSGKSGVLRFETPHPGLVEFRGLCVGSTARNWEWSGFAIISNDGDVIEADREMVEAYMNGYAVVWQEMAA